MIFIDADFFIGFYHTKDIHHIRCNKLFDTINDGLLTSWDVIDETATKLTYFTDKQNAVKFLEGLKRIQMKVVYPTSSLLDDATEIFQSQTSKKVSLTDCMNMAIAKSLGITTFLSFDKIYEKNGFKLFK